MLVQRSWAMHHGMPSEGGVNSYSNDVRTPQVRK
jgi:hypothetical protein